jgi:hypothetical protein
VLFPAAAACCSWLLLPRAVPGRCRVLFLAAARASVQDQSPHIEDKGKSGQTFFGAVEYTFEHKPMVAIMENSPSTRKHPSGWGNKGVSTTAHAVRADRPRSTILGAESVLARIQDLRVAIGAGDAALRDNVMRRCCETLGLLDDFPWHTASLPKQCEYNP